MAAKDCVPELLNARLPSSIRVFGMLFELVFIFVFGLLLYICMLFTASFFISYTQLFFSVC